MKQNQIHHGERVWSASLLRNFPVTTSVALLASISLSQASGDYGPAIWNPVCSGHWYTTGSGHKFHVIHDMEGYYASTISYFKNCSTSASVHYCVNGKQDASSDAPAGEITQMVAEANYAWHVRCWNQYCTGTEHEGFASNPAWYTEAMYQASAGISGHECDKFGYPRDRNHVVGHNEWQNAAWRSYAGGAFGIDTSCNTHTDPGVYWDWSHYMSLVSPPPGVTDPLVSIGREPNGALDVFFRGGDNSLWHTVQNTPGNSSSWSGHIRLGSASCYMDSAPTVGTNANGALDVFFRGGDNALWHIYQTSPGGAWSSEQRLGGSGLYLASAPVWGHQADGRQDVFFLGGDNALWHIYQTAPNGGWSYETRMGASFSTKPAVGYDADGRVEVFFQGGDNAMWHFYQTAVNGGWSSETRMGAWFTSIPVTGHDADGRMEVFFHGGDNALWHFYQTAPNGGWSSETRIGSGLTSVPNVGYNADGRMEVFFRGNDYAVWDRYQTAVSNSGAWSNEVRFGSYMTCAATTATNSDGRQETFWRGSDGALWHVYQTSPNSSWSAISTLSGYLSLPNYH